MSGGGYVAPAKGTNTIGTITMPTLQLGGRGYAVRTSLTFAGGGTFQALDDLTVNSTIVTTSNVATIDTNGYTAAA